MSDHPLEQFLRAEDGDPGCGKVAFVLTAYVEMELAGLEPAGVYRATALHLQSCPACREDHDGLLQAARGFGHTGPE